MVTYSFALKITLETDPGVGALLDEYKKTLIKAMLEKQIEKTNLSMTGGKTYPVKVEVNN